MSPIPVPGCGGVVFLVCTWCYREQTVLLVSMVLVTDKLSPLFPLKWTARCFNSAGGYIKTCRSVEQSEF